MIVRSRGERVLGVLLEEQEKRGGSLPFREFMRLALYHPELGYYAQNIREVGKGGDFTTVPTVSSLLAKAVFEWTEKIRREVPCLRDAPVIEVGGGSGAMAVSFFRAMGWRRFFSFFSRPYWLVDVSRPLGEQQERRAGKGRVRRFSSVGDALEAAGGKAIFFSNELVDAFPCSVWEMGEGGWKEVGVRVEEERVCEVLLERELPDSTIFLQGGETFAFGQRVETHEAWKEWLAEWSPKVEAGAMLTIDYGALAAEVYRQKRKGSLRGYWRQERYEGGGVYSRFGMQDLTADVNFSDVERWGEAAGWKTSSIAPLADFLRRWQGEGFGGEDGRFFDLQDAGGAFLVCEAVKR